MAFVDADAARAVCEPTDRSSLKQLADRTACLRGAMSGAKDQRDMLVARAEAQRLAARKQQSGPSI